MVALPVLLLLLDAAGMNSMDAYGTLSNELAKETDELNALITKWSDAMDHGGFKTAADAQQWMDDLQSLKNDMDATPFDEKTHALIDDQFTKIYDQPALTPTYAGYQDNEGNPVNASGQAVDANGYPLYEVENSKKDNGTTAYYKDGNYYIEGSNPPQKVDSDKGTSYKPLYWTDDPSAKGGLTDKSGNVVSGRSNPTSTVSGINGVEYDNYYYASIGANANGTHDTFVVSASGKAPPGATVYTSNDPNFKGDQYYLDNSGNTVFLNPPANTTKVTLSDQAYQGGSYRYVNYSFYNNGHTTTSVKYGSSDQVQATMNLYQPKEINPNNSATGGFPLEGGDVDSSLNALSNPLSQQTSAVGAEMQQTADWVELVDNTFTSTLLDTNTGYAGTMKTINSNLRA